MVALRMVRRVRTGEMRDGSMRVHTRKALPQLRRQVGGAMSEQLYRQTVHTDGNQGHWFAYEPAIELVRCKECYRFYALGNGNGFCFMYRDYRNGDEYCSDGAEVGHGDMDR